MCRFQKDTPRTSTIDAYLALAVVVVSIPVQQFPLRMNRPNVPKETCVRFRIFSKYYNGMPNKGTRVVNGFKMYLYNKRNSEFLSITWSKIQE